jgi:hypothetical protein
MKSKHHTYTIDTTLTPRATRIKVLKKSRDPDKQYKHETYLNQKLIIRYVSEASSSRTWTREGTSRRESTDRPTLPPNSSFTLYLTIFYLQKIATNVETILLLIADVWS